MDNDIPLRLSIFHILASSHTDAISPEMSDFLERVLESSCIFAIFILDLLDKLVVEQLGIGLNVNTWFIMLEVLFN